MKILVWIILLLSVFTGRAQQLPAAAQRVLDSLLRAQHLPALAAAIIEPGRIRYVLGGTRRIDQPSPVQLTDFWHLGSNTKAITSFVAARLVARGKLRWDSRLLDVVPGLRGHVRPEYVGVTLGALLTHRAGIRPYNSGAELTELPAFTGTVSQQRLQFAQFVLQQSPVPPGPAAYAYSNAGYALAALMLERSAHCSWEAQVARTCRRLHLRERLGFPNRADPSQPWGHWLASPADSTLTALGPALTYRIQPVLAPAGDVAMPLPDYARFVQLHLQGLLGQGNYLKASTYQLLHFGQPAYAYGWAVSKLVATSAPISLHDGSAGTFFCHTIIYPSEQVAFVVITNAGGAAAEQACYALRRQLRKILLIKQL
ncbi:serine hydrolase domain-containing protein [Hymenobacter sp. H14-R3]|uniref:serine hydrolase domain-containing protein n=1 Tax=Hymenobacter sp. H14-R3 TaxID=3046308 RepID=UPI0024BBA117|nr:serine hydrolase domain-containing protein [Hymenobacter sp. H14-R3]MDJ0366541.1 serine hydrolase domain-containing protein [Hymenobacter sp. H14-R3]